jgi:hypothetical protein
LHCVQSLLPNSSGKRPTWRIISSIIRLFESPTCFEQLCAHPQEDNFINTTSGIITLCVTAPPTCRTATNTVIIPEVVLIQLSSWGWAHSCSKHVGDSNKHIIAEIVRQVGHLPEEWGNKLWTQCNYLFAKTRTDVLVAVRHAGRPLTQTDYTRSCINTTVLLRMSTELLETCRGFK